MANVKDLPGSSSNFRATLGPGSFSKKLNRATVAGNLSNLRDNRESIIKAIKQHETAIRRGSFNRLRQINAMKSIKQAEGSNLTKNDAKKIRQILKHLGSGEKNIKSTESKINIEKDLDKDASFAEERWARRKAEMSAKMTRYTKSRTGGEAELKFVNHPEVSDRDDKSSVSGRLITRRFQAKEQKFKKRLPSHLVHWDEERKKRFEVSSLEKTSNQKDPENNENKNNTDKNFFQNL